MRFGDSPATRVMARNDTRRCVEISTKKGIRCLDNIAVGKRGVTDSIVTHPGNTPRSFSNLVGERGAPVRLSTVENSTMNRGKRFIGRRSPHKQTGIETRNQRVRSSSRINGPSTPAKRHTAHRKRQMVRNRSAGEPAGIAPRRTTHKQMNDITIINTGDECCTLSHRRKPRIRDKRQVRL